MSEDSLRDVLQALTREDAGREAPPDVEIRLRQAFRSRRRRRAFRQVAIWMSAAVLMGTIFVTWNRKPAVIPVVKTLPSETRVPASRQAAASIGERPVPIIEKRKSVRPRPAESQEIVTDFFPIMDPAPPFQRGQILRIEVPASAMQMVGLPVREDRLKDPVQADVLIGEEGLPRAIRFVKLDREIEKERE